MLMFPALSRSAYCKTAPKLLGTIVKSNVLLLRNVDTFDSLSIVSPRNTTFWFLYRAASRFICGISLWHILHLVDQNVTRTTFPRSWPRSYVCPFMPAKENAGAADPVERPC